MTDGAVKRQRTCIGCGRRFEKTSLQRVVRTPEGSVMFDPTGRAAGRGAYVCSEQCLENALAKRKLDRALKCKVVGTDFEAAGSKLRAAFDSDAR